MVIEQGRVLFNYCSFKYYKIDATNYKFYWDLRKSSFIESIIMNLPINPINPIILYEYRYNQFKLFDGKERINAIESFIKNEYPLEKLTYLPELNGLYYKNLPREIVDRLDRKYIPTMTIFEEEGQDPDKIYNKIRRDYNVNI